MVVCVCVCVCVCVPAELVHGGPDEEGRAGGERKEAVRVAQARLDAPAGGGGTTTDAGQSNAVKPILVKTILVKTILVKNDIGQNDAGQNDTGQERFWSKRYWSLGSALMPLKGTGGQQALVKTTWSKRCAQNDWSNRAGQNGLVKQNRSNGTGQIDAGQDDTD